MNAITLQQLRSYLAAQDWELTSAPDEFVEIWRSADTEGGEILLPTEQAIDRDFLLHGALLKLAALMGVTFSELTQSIRELTENLISIRVAHPDVQDGSIPLEDGIALNANAKELLYAAASAALERRPVHQGRPPTPVSSLIQNARLGQTTQGSYVIHVFFKESVESEGSLDFARVATQTLATALTCLRGALDDYERSASPLAFEMALSQGASANLCDAIARFAGKDRARVVEISLNTDSIGQLTRSPRTVVEFPPRHQPHLRAAADYYRQTYVLPNEAIIGVVERLERRAEQEMGTARVATTLSNGAQRSVSMQLGADEYEIAIHAHENKHLVQVSGQVIVTPRTANMAEPTGFRVYGNYPLFDGR